MFISLLVGFPLLFIFHCLVHALFKSLLFLVAGSLIHVQFNSQSIFKLCYFNLSFDIKPRSEASYFRHGSAESAAIFNSFKELCFNYSCSNLLIRSLFIIGSSALILSFSKEGIIHSSSFIINSSFIFQCLVLGGFFTCCYLFRIYFLVFRTAQKIIKPDIFASIPLFSSIGLLKAELKTRAKIASRFSSSALLFSSLLRFNASSFYLVCFSFFSFNSFLFDIMFSYLFSLSFFYSIFNFHDSFFFIDLIPFSLLFPYFIFLFFLVLLVA
jgi:NADH:ubiquinone oxidoreductase subunit 5 (subunit L)/multisubunit Na+/H+ antiporter MnhA subunit